MLRGEEEEEKGSGREVKRRGGEEGKEDGKRKGRRMNREGEEVQRFTGSFINEP